MTLPDTIGGHSRRQWISTMHDIENVPDMIAIAEDAYARANGDVRIAPHSARVVALHDPAKLAELLASEARRLGVSGNVEHNYGYAFPIKWYKSEHLFVPFTMVQARAILLQWLDLPDGAREQAERVLVAS